MNNNAKILYPYYKELYDKVINEDFIIDKSGVKTVELISPRIVFNTIDDGYIDFNVRKTPRDYIIQEKSWYYSQDLNIEQVSNVDIWNKVCDLNKEINSNYGNLVYSRNNFSQFTNVIKTLSNHKESRQGIIIYTRPSIHYEWNSLGASDFICTNYQQFFIRNNKLITITSMRSNDAIFGIFNDLPWFTDVIRSIHCELIKVYPDVVLGEHIFIPNSFHIYERHFKLLEKIIQEQ